MKLTASEQIGYEHLKRTFPDKKIERLVNPDFKVDDALFEVKQVHGELGIEITKRQEETFDKLNPSIIVIRDGEWIETVNWSVAKSFYRIRTNDNFIVTANLTDETSKIYNKINETKAKGWFSKDINELLISKYGSEEKILTEQMNEKTQERNRLDEQIKTLAKKINKMK